MLDSVQHILGLVLLLAPGEVVAPVVMPASGVVVAGLPADVFWESEGTLLVGASDQRPVDRLHAWNERHERLLTVEVRRERCPHQTPAETSPWPTLGFAAMRAPLPERRTVRSCKAPDLMVELRFPAGTPTEPELLLEEADRWEPVIAALHKAYGQVTIDLPGAAAARERLTLEPAPNAPPDTLARFGAPLTLRGGLLVNRAADRMPWLVRMVGGQEFLTLTAPTGAGLGFQLVPFDGRYLCDEALDLAMRGHPPAEPDRPPVRVPPGWDMARPIGADQAAFCLHGPKGGLIAIGGGRVPRDAWQPISMPILGRIAEAYMRR